MTNNSAQTEQYAPTGPASCTCEPWLWANDPRGQPESERLWSGKWLWFPPMRLLDTAWDTVREATQNSLLGYCSKAATLINSRPGSDDSRRPICVYTHDWRDIEDVRRVLTALRGLGIVDVLVYKTDADTKRGRYGRAASTYMASPGRRDVIIPRRTELLLEHHHTARRNARKAAEQRKRTLSARGTDAS